MQRFVIFLDTLGLFVGNTFCSASFFFRAFYHITFFLLHCYLFCILFPSGSSYRIAYLVGVEIAYILGSTMFLGLQEKIINRSIAGSKLRGTSLTSQNWSKDKLWETFFVDMFGGRKVTTMISCRFLLGTNPILHNNSVFIGLSTLVFDG